MSAEVDAESPDVFSVLPSYEGLWSLKCPAACPVMSSSSFSCPVCGYACAVLRPVCMQLDIVQSHDQNSMQSHEIDRRA
jgi:hypothetical protein